MIPRWAKAIIGVIVFLMLAAFAFAMFEPIQVLPRIRVAPGYNAVDQTGTPFSSDDGTGVVTIYSFAPAGECDSTCDYIVDTMKGVRDNIAAEPVFEAMDVRFVTVALDTDDAADLAEAADRWDVNAEDWRWIGTPEERRKDLVGRGFEVYYDDAETPVDFDAVFVIVDGNGLIRGEYRYTTLSPDVDRLTRHLSLLAAEIAHADGNLALMYEAAHLFLCYP